MKKLSKTIAVLLTSIAFHSVAFAQTNDTVTTKATASLAASCDISAQNVNFGNLNLMTAQSGQTATSNMNILCSLNSPYTVELAYGGVYGTVTQGDYYIDIPFNPGAGYYQYTPSGQATGKVFSTRPEGTTYNATTGKYTTAPTTYAYGELVGVAHGDSVTYKITVPGNDNEIWNNGNYTYSATGTGANQSIPIKATATTSSYPTPDYYMDTVTATVNF